MYFTLTNPFRLPAILNDDSCCSAGDYIIYIRIFYHQRCINYALTYTLYKLEISIEEIQLLLLAHQPKSLVHMPLPSPPAQRTARGQTT